MASSNKTPNYGLSQFLGTDKPAWLADYNADMLAIDTGINGAKSAAQGAQTAAGAADAKADAATSAAEAATATAETAKSTAGAAQQTATNAATTANNAANTANEAKNTANTAKNTADSASTAAVQVRADLARHEEKLRVWGSSLLVPSAAVSQNYLYFRDNTEIGLLQIDGYLVINGTVAGQQTVIGTLPLNIERPLEDTKFAGAVNYVFGEASSIGSLYIKANGGVAIDAIKSGLNYAHISILTPSPIQRA